MDLSWGCLRRPCRSHVCCSPRVITLELAGSRSPFANYRRGLRPHRRVAPKLRGQQTSRYTRCQKGRHRRDCCYSARERYFLWRRATAPQAVGDGLAGSWRYGCDGRGANRHVASSTVDASWITGVILTGFVARERVPIGHRQGASRCSRGTAFSGGRRLVWLRTITHTRLGLLSAVGDFVVDASAVDRSIPHLRVQRNPR